MRRRWRVLLTTIVFAYAAPSASDAAPTVVATVLSHPIYADQLDPTPEEQKALDARGAGSAVESFRARRLEALIVGPLRKRFCADRDCKPTQEEVRAFSHVMAAPDSPDAADQERREARRMARDFIASWKFHKALQERYGGEVIWQVLGPNAVEARRRWLEAEEASGSFQIPAADLRAAFYKAVGGYGGNRVPPEEATKAFLHPPWESTPARAVALRRRDWPSASPTESAPLDTIGRIRLSCDSARSALEQQIHSFETAYARNPNIPTTHLEGPVERSFSERERLFAASTLNPEARAAADACLAQLRALEDRLHEMPRPDDRHARPTQP